jgi:flagellar hook-basal body complex protein FliE
MIERATSQANIQSMLETLRSYQSQATQQGAEAAAAAGTSTTAKAGFGQLITGALEQVSGMQNEAQRLQTSYEMGDDIPLADVVLGMQKSSIAFEATLQIRNKVLKAYEDILNMPV